MLSHSRVENRCCAESQKGGKYTYVRVPNISSLRSGL